MSEVILRGSVVVPQSDLEKVLAALPLHVELTRREPGCLQFDVIQDSGQPGVFHVFERFVDDEAFELHQARVRESAWWLATQNAERRYQVSR